MRRSQLSDTVSAPTSTSAVILLPEGKAVTAGAAASNTLTATAAMRGLDGLDGLQDALQQAQATVVPLSRVSEASVAVVDVGAPGAADAVARLRAAVGDDVVLIAVADWNDPAQLELAQTLGVSDIIGRSRLSAELPFRLRKADARRKLRKETTQRQKELQLLLRLTSDYAESLDVEDILHDVTRRLAEELDILRASLVVLDDKGAVGYVIAASDDESIRELKIELSRYPEIREVLRTAKPVIVDDVPTHPLLEGVKTEVSARGIHSIAALPLAIQGKVLGVLLLRASPRRKGFTPREIDLLATVAHATAIALRNAKLIETQRGQAEAEKTARIAAEQRARQLERYETYFASISEGIAIVGEKANILTLNPAGTQLLDVSAQDARGRHINALTNPGDQEVLLEMLSCTARGETKREVDLAVRTPKGRELTLSVCAAPIHEGEAAAIISFRDVTAQRQMAEELRSTKDFLERLIDSSVDAIIAADLKGNIILFNKGAEAIVGYTPEEAMTRINVRQIYPAGVAQEIMRRLRSSTEGGKGRLGVTRQDILTKKGERVPVNMTASILYEGDREVATVGIFTDLRDRMQLERKLSDAEIRLEESERNAVIVALAGTAAHELNQPLTSVMGYAELLKRKLTEADFAYRPIDIIYREAERMAEIVRKIGKITRFETKQYVGSSQILDLDKASSHED